jgi:hypothetical protein
VDCPKRADDTGRSRIEKSVRDIQVFINVAWQEHAAFASIDHRETISLEIEFSEEISERKPLLGIVSASQN